ncbi:hypothetical protein NDU88_004144 [Pleurodeles waltl]|uniref:Uncharacterized protein n=1 Tax=Pleurodeles waltl TaxID=8319 RepID=A0AAV7M8D6_PLEWA|nr:hypothetical protein NDU88_004144 [Pleurodeles waltl]
MMRAPAPTPGLAAYPRRAVTAARLSPEGPGTRPQESSAILGPSGPGPAAHKNRPEKPLDPTGGAATVFQRGHRAKRVIRWG